MPHDKAIAAPPSPKDSDVVFTVERANRALVIVRRIVADVVARYRELTDIRAQLADLDGESHAQSRRRANLQQRGDRSVELLNGLHRELQDIGCELKDWRTGLIDFPAVHEGRQVWLCWRLGEPKISSWHELHEGFSGRRPVTDGFGLSESTEGAQPDLTP